MYMKDITKCKIRPSKHVLERMTEGAVDKKHIKRVIVFGTKQIRRNGKGSKLISIMDGLRVIYRTYPCNIFLITVHLLR